MKVNILAKIAFGMTAHGPVAMHTPFYSRLPIRLENTSLSVVYEKNTKTKH
jgi:hypothetical protein